MRSPLRSSVLVTSLVALSALVACDGDTSPPPTPAPTTTPAVPDPGPGAYAYADFGVEATLVMDGAAGTLDVVNDGEASLDVPTPFVLDAASGERIELIVTDPEPTAAGERASFAVSFPAEPVPIGLAVLRFGQDEYGAMTPEGAA